MPPLQVRSPYQIQVRSPNLYVKNTLTLGIVSKLSNLWVYDATTPNFGVVASYGHKIDIFGIAVVGC